MDKQNVRTRKSINVTKITGFELTVRTSHFAKRFCKIEKLCEAEILVFSKNCEARYLYCIQFIYKIFILQNLYLFLINEACDFSPNDKPEGRFFFEERLSKDLEKV